MQLPPPIHGASLVNSNIANSELVKRSFDTKILEIRFVSNLDQMGKFSAKKIALIFPLIWRLLRLLTTFRPDLIYFTITPKGFAFYRDSILVFLIKAFRIKLAFHLHSRGIQQSIKSNSVKKIIYKCVFKNAEIISLAKSLNYEFDGIPVKKIHILPNGIEGRQFDYSKKDSTEPVILFLANLFKNKGIFIFLEIIKQLKASSISFKANIVGKDGDISVSQLTGLVKDYNISDVTHISGALYGDQKHQALETASIFVHPSLDEAFPLTILEAMQAALPVVASSVGAIPEMVVPEITGFVCEPGDIKDFCKKLTLLLNDADLRNKMGKECIMQFNGNYTMKRFENRLKEIIDDILA